MKPEEENELRERIARDIEAQAAASAGVFVNPGSNAAAQAAFRIAADIARGGS